MPQYQKLFKLGFIETHCNNLTKGKDIDLYEGNTFPFTEADILENKRILVSETPKLSVPTESDFLELENAVKLFGAFKNLSRTQATDVRIWTYMSHVQYWDYMKARWPSPTDNQKDKKINHILQHWYMKTSDSKSISRHGIASLWWGAFITYDKQRKDPFELTAEFFSKQDYKRLILEQNIAFYKPLVHAILEYVIEHYGIFDQYKYWEPRIRFLIRKINFIRSYKLLATLSKTSIKDIIEGYTDDLMRIEPENPISPNVEKNVWV